MNKREILGLLEKLPKEDLAEMLEKYNEYHRTYTQCEAESKDTFTVCKIPDDVQEELEAYDDCSSSSLSEHTKKWVTTVKNLPTETNKLAKLDNVFIKYSTVVWKNKISGLTAVYEKLIEHIVRFLQTGATRPLLFVGTPGCGKTRVAKVIGEMLGLPMHFANAVQMATGNGLSGHSKTYVAATPGEVIEGMVRNNCANYVFVIDEVDKAQQYAGHAGNFQNELLMLLSDESAQSFKDNFIGFCIDASHLFIVMTANELEHVSAPLRSRCDIVEFPSPDADTITSILKEHTVPSMCSKLKCTESVAVKDEAISYLVSTLGARGTNDVRQYQNIIEGCINRAYLNSITTGQVAFVDKTCVQALIEQEKATIKRPIGF